MKMFRALDFFVLRRPAGTFSYTYKSQRVSCTIKASDCSFSNLLAGPKRKGIGNLVACEEWRQESRRGASQTTRNGKGKELSQFGRNQYRQKRKADSHPVKSWEWTCAQNERERERARVWTLPSNEHKLKVSTWSTSTHAHHFATWSLLLPVSNLPFSSLHSPSFWLRWINDEETIFINNKTRHRRIKDWKEKKYQAKNKLNNK
jgi:hypothetical protein